MGAYRAALAALLVMAGCGGNPFVEPTGTVVPTDPETGEPTATAAANGVLVNNEVKGNMNSVAYATTAAGPIRVNINAQDSAVLEGSYARNRALDVGKYKAYSHQESGSNRLVVALVSQELDSARALVAVDGGQFTNYHGGGLYSRAEAFVKPAGGAQQKFNYSGTYAGLVNFGTATPGGPGGDLNPTQSYRTRGRVLITADFDEMAISGGIDRRRIVDTGDALATQMLYDGAIDETGNFTGKTQRLDVDETTGTGTFTDSGTYGGIFAGPNASEIAAVFVFKPIKEEERAEERGVFTSDNCVIASGPACRP